jgi:hypothetical protein
MALGGLLAAQVVLAVLERVAVVVPHPLQEGLVVLEVVEVLEVQLQALQPPEGLVVSEVAVAAMVQTQPRQAAPVVMGVVVVVAPATLVRLYPLAALALYYSFGQRDTNYEIRMD